MASISYIIDVRLNKRIPYIISLSVPGIRQKYMSILLCFKVRKVLKHYWTKINRFLAFRKEHVRRSNRKKLKARNTVHLSVTKKTNNPTQEFEIQ